MNQLSLKTKILNIFRNVSKWAPIEKQLVKRTQGKELSNFFVKLVPNYYQYDKGEVRKVNREGINFELDISDYMEYVIYYGMNSEPKGRISELFKDGDTILDVGANIGETLLYFAKHNQSGNNIGFEPVPYIFDRLQNNISLNSFPNIKSENIAISDVNEILSFKMPNNQNSGGVRMRKENSKEKYGASLEVQAITLDDYVQKSNISKIDLIKMDVEGFEYNVIVGGEKTLREFGPKLFIEIDDKMLQQQGVSAKKMFDKLISLKYKILDPYKLDEINLEQDFENCHFDIVCVQS